VALRFRTVRKVGLSWRFTAPAFETSLIVAVFEPRSRVFQPQVTACVPCPSAWARSLARVRRDRGLGADALVLLGNVFMPNGLRSRRNFYRKSEILVDIRGGCGVKSCLENSRSANCLATDEHDN
jgi:hypothetical protein